MWRLNGVLNVFQCASIVYFYHKTRNCEIVCVYGFFFFQLLFSTHSVYVLRMIIDWKETCNRLFVRYYGLIHAVFARKSRFWITNWNGNVSRLAFYWNKTVCAFDFIRCIFLCDDERKLLLMRITSGHAFDKAECSAIENEFYRQNKGIENYYFDKWLSV